MKTLLASFTFDIQFSQLIMLSLLIVLAGLAVYQLISFLRNSNDKSMYY